IPRLDQDSKAELYSIPGLPPDLSHPPAWCRFQPRCRYAIARCREEEPPLDGDTPEHQFACFNPVGKAGAHPVAVSS
ncbi:MAG TPA: oligopeptide/dipeptide ABC transporter ATP-binding protein, partial [Candidatus Dormibacteraeota bacterium]